jgi:ABC-type nitrate/sulfonate/bicarbonate transport system permease component
MLNIESNDGRTGFSRGGLLSLSRYLLPLLVLVVWDAASHLGLVSSLFLPSPSKIVESIWRLIVEDDLLANLAHTLMRLAMGFVLGSVAGVLLALLMVGFTPVGRALDPLVSGLYAIPKVAFLPMLVIWLGIGEVSKVSLIAVGAFFPLLINIYIGAKSVNPVLLRAARNLGASERQVLFRVILPAVLPEMFAGLKLGFGVALTLAVYAEMIGVGSGIGYLTQTSAQLFDMGKAYGSLVILIIIAVGSQMLLAVVQARMCRWQQDRPPIIE